MMNGNGRKQINHILIVDDDEVSAFVTQRLLQLFNTAIKLSHVENGKKAIMLLENFESNCPEIILLDINMPEMNGFEFLDQFYKNGWCGKSKIAMYTSSNLLDDKIRALQYPDVVAYFQKPINKQKVKQLLEDI